MPLWPLATLLGALVVLAIVQPLLILWAHRSDKRSLAAKQRQGKL